VPTLPAHLSEAQLGGRACIRCDDEHTPQRPVEASSVLSQGRVGWFPRTEPWSDGEFFRFALTELRLVTA
jgi:hypothetical protein